MSEEYWKHKKYSYFSHKDCEYFPCHKEADINNFNCLFCYCPLYLYGDKCGGVFKYTDKGIKDCSECLLPHKKENYGNIIQKIEEMAKKNSKVKNIIE